MEKCFVTDFVREESIPNLQKIDTITLSIKFTLLDNYIKIRYSEATGAIKFESDKPLYWGKQVDKSDATLGTSKSWDDSITVYVWGSDITQDVKIYIPKKSILEYINRYSNDYDNAKVEYFNFSSELTYIDLQAIYDFSKAEGLDSLTTMPPVKIGSDVPLERIPINIVNVSFNNTNKSAYHGSLSSFEDKTHLKILNFDITSDYDGISGNINKIPVGVEEIIMPRMKNIGGSISDLSGHSSLTKLRINRTNLTGSINNLPKSLTQVEIYGTPITGDLKTMADNHVSAGRTSGTLSIQVNGVVTYNGAAVSGTKTIKYGSSMVNPTADETTQGWQIS